LSGKMLGIFLFFSLKETLFYSTLFIRKHLFDK